MSNDIYVALPRPIDAGADRRYDTLRLRVSHRRAGTSITGKPYHAGHALSLVPCAIRNGWMESTFLGADQWTSGFLMTLNDLPRKNPHYIRRAMRLVDELKESIAEAFIARDGVRLATLAASINARSVKPSARRGA